MALATSIGQKFANDKKDLVISITTPVSQAMAKTNPDRPIVFCLVTDPVGAGLLKNPEAPEANITGVTDFYKIENHLDLIKELLPEAKTIGLLYNAGEANSVALVEKEEKPKAEAMGYKTVSATAASSAEVAAAAQSLVGRVDVISITTDNTIVSGLEAVLKIAAENKIPVVVCDVDSVQRGAARRLRHEQRVHGQQGRRHGRQDPQRHSGLADPDGDRHRLRTADQPECREGDGCHHPGSPRGEGREGLPVDRHLRMRATHDRARVEAASTGSSTWLEPGRPRFQPTGGMAANEGDAIEGGRPC